VTLPDRPEKFTQRGNIRQKAVVHDGKLFVTTFFHTTERWNGPDASTAPLFPHGQAFLAFLVRNVLKKISCEIGFKFVQLLLVLLQIDRLFESSRAQAFLGA